MNEIGLIGIDLAKTNVDVCCMDVDGVVVHERRFRRAGLVSLLQSVPPCVVAMEARGGAHERGRRLGAITKRGNTEIRKSPVQGARSIIPVALVALAAPGAAPGAAKQPRNQLEAWIQNRAASLHSNVLAVAVANKLARIAWAVLKRERPFVANPAD